jgi:hypothetical protein
MDISQHPDIKRIQAEVEEVNRKAERQRLQDQAEAARLRGEQGKYLAAQFNSAVEEYEVLRKQTHATVGKIWAAVQAYSRLTGFNPPGFLDQTFNEINVPTLIQDPSPWANFNSGFSTTRASVMNWFSNMGKEWR